METVIRIEGMNCEHCASKVQRTLEEMAEVTAEVSLAEGLARIRHPDDTDPSDLEAAVQRAGYTPLPPDQP